MKDSEYWRGLKNYNEKRKKWKDRQVDKAVDIPPPINRGRPAYNGEALIKFLNNLEIGDSFIIGKDEWKSGPATVLTHAKKVGKKLTSRKIYHEDDPNDFHYRVWYVEDIDPVKPEKKRKPYDVVHRQDPAIGNYDACMGKLPNDILFLAEQNEENREIVEDIRRLNRILIEELAKQNIKLPKQGE